MAEKGFGVKEINLIGPSGTPTITSPNNLNLNAVNVAISTNVSIGGTLSVTGNVSVGGTLTYEDVTNIDSVGLITARSGVSVTSGGIQVLAGVSRFNANVIGTATTAISVTAADESSDTSCNVLFSTAATGNVAPKTGTNLTFNSSNGTLTATTFSGSGASLTNLPAANITGTLPAISGANLTNLPADTPTNSDIQVAYTVTANGSSAYRFAGNGVVSTADDPDLYLIRGHKYRFINNSGGSHPFQIREASGGTAYSTGVTNNGAASGNIDFAPTYDSPAQLVYQCTSHSGMVGNIYLRDAAGTNTNVGVTTFSGFTHVKTAVINTAYQTIESTATNSYPYLRLKNDAREYQLSCHGGQSDSFNIYDGTAGAYRFTIASDGTISLLSNVDMNVGTGEVDIYSTGSGDQLSLRLLNSDASAGNKIGIYFGPANNVAGAYIKAVAESDFTSTANRDAGLEFGTRLNGNFLTPLKISAGGIVTKPSYHPCFRAGRSTDITPGSQSTIVFNYVANPTHFNQGGHYDNSTGAFTAPVAGIYNFYCQVLWEGLSSGQNMDDAFYVMYNSSGGASGGTLVSYDARRAEYIANETGNAGYYGAHTSIMVAMAAGGSVYIRNNRGSIVVHGNANFSFFQGYLVG